MEEKSKMKVSILNLVPLRQGESYKEAMDRMVNLAKKAEELGYTRYWIAEHHNTPFRSQQCHPAFDSVRLKQYGKNQNRFRRGDAAEP